jgi:hypothetical protein
LAFIAFGVLTLAGCGTGGMNSVSVPTTKPTTTTSTTRVALWEAPPVGTSIGAAEIPPPGPGNAPGAGEFAAAGIICREYDAAHGTSSNLMNQYVLDDKGAIIYDPEYPDDPLPVEGPMVADTPCLDNGG